MKAIINFLLLLPLFVSIPACAVHSNSGFNSNNFKVDQIVGTWEHDDTIYIFNKNGELHSPNNISTSPDSWKMEGEVLTLSFLDSPISEKREEKWKILFLRSSSMSLENNEGERITFNKRKNSGIQTITGEFFFLERIALPSEIVLRVDIMQNNEIVHSSLTTKIGNVPIPFDTYFFENDIKKNEELKISAVVYFQENVIFHTEQAQTIPNETSTLKPIRLIRSNPDEMLNEELNVPLSYSFYKEKDDEFVAAQLYLESNNLFFLIQQKGQKGIIGSRINSSEELSWGHWNQTNRGYGIELLLENNDALLGSINPNHIITFDNLPTFNGYSPIHFKETELKGKTSREFKIIGEIRKVGNTFNFKPCGLDIDFPLENKNINITINQDIKNFAEIEAQYTRKNSQPAFILNSIISQKNTDMCTQNENLYSLENTYWRLLSLGTKEIMKNDNPEPHLILRIDENSNDEAKKGEGSGSDGCNSFFLGWENGSLKNNEDSLKFMLGGSTMRLCDEQTSKQVAEYMQALDKTENYSIKGSILELKQEDSVLATFEAVEF